MGGGVGQVFKDLGSALTAGIVDFDRGRVNVPFSGAQMRQATKSTINAVTMSGVTAPGFREDLNRSLDTKTARVLGKVAGAVAAAATGAGIASQIGHGASTAAEVGDAIEMTGDTAGVLGEVGAVAPTVAPSAAASTAGLTSAATPMTTAYQAAQAAQAAAPAAEAASQGLTAGQALLGSTALTVGGTAYQAMTNKPPALPSAPDTSALDQAAASARNSAQSAEAESRRQRNARRQSSVLSNVLPGVSSVGISPATLQPAPARRSVLG